MLPANRHSKRLNRSSKTPRLFEGLEQRHLMAGDVTAFVDNGNLIIQGDNASNAVEISQFRDGQFVVLGLQEGFELTTVNSRGGAFLQGVTGDVIVKLDGGDDRLVINNRFQQETQTIPDGEALEMITVPRSSTIRGSLTIDSGAGNDRVDIRSTAVGANVDVSTGSGDDDVDLSNVDVGARIDMRTGLGDDTVRLSSITTEDGSSIDVTMSDGSDAFLMQRINHRGSLQIDSGVGDDNISAIGRNEIRGDFSLITAEGHDTVDVDSLSTFQRLDVGRNLEMDSGDGDDTIRLEGINVSQDVSIETGAGNDSVLLTSVSPLERNLTVITGDGDDVVEVDELDVWNSFTLETSDGRDQVTLSQLRVGFVTPGPLPGLMNVKTGSDQDRVVMQDVEVLDDIEVNLGQGNNTLYMSDVSAGNGFQGDGDISVFAGVGRDSVVINRVQATDSIMADVGAGDDELLVQFSQAERARFNLGLGRDQHQLWENDFDELDLIDPARLTFVPPSLSRFRLTR